MGDELNDKILKVTQTESLSLPRTYSHGNSFVQTHYKQDSRQQNASSESRLN